MNKNLIEFLNGCTDEEKEEAFNKLDNELHNDDETRLAYSNKVETLESENYILEQRQAESTVNYRPEPETFIDYIMPKK